MTLPCNHHEACMYRYLYKGQRLKYCMACIVEKHPDCNIMSEEYRKKWDETKQPEKIVTTEKVEEVKKEVKNRGKKKSEHLKTSTETTVSG